MKKNLFSKGIYAESLRRLRVFGIIALAVMIIIQLAPFIISITSHYSQLRIYEYEKEMYGSIVVSPEPFNTNFSTILMAVPFVSIAVSPLMTLIVFSVFNKRASSDFYHSLPYTRPCMFISTLAAVFTWTVGISLVCAVIGLASYHLFPSAFTVIYDGALDLIFSYVALMLLTTGATALAMSTTGTSLSNICVTLLILFLPRFIITIITKWISGEANFLALNQVTDSFFSYNINLLAGSAVNLFFYGEGISFTDNIASDVYTSLLGIVYLAVSLVVFTHRKSETATQPAPTRAVQHIIRITLSLVVGLIATILFLEGTLAGGIIVLLLTAVVYFAYEIITTRRWKNCLKALPFFGVVIGLCIACGAIMIWGPYAASLYTPAKGDIDSVRFVSAYSYYNDDWFGRDAQDLEITDEAIIEEVAKTLDHNMKFYRENGYVGEFIYDKNSDDKYYGEVQSNCVSQTFAIKQGIFTKYRTIYFKLEDYQKIISSLSKNEEYMAACKTLPKPAKNSLDFDIYDRDVEYTYYEKVFECLQKEINDLPFDRWYSIAKSPSNADFRLYYFTEDFDTVRVYIPITSADFPKTFDMLLETDKIDRERRMKELEYILFDEEFAENEKIWNMQIDTRLVMTDSEGKTSYYFLDIYYNLYDSAAFDLKAHLERAEGLRELYTYAKNTGEFACAERHVLISYSYETEGEYIRDYIYLPVPEDCDPEALGLYADGVNEPAYYD